jgi:hypothetical protein
MIGAIMIRKWELRFGTGSKLILVLPRKDSSALSQKEWENMFVDFLDDYKFIVVDFPEKLMQERKVSSLNIDDFDWSVGFMADELSTLIESLGKVYCTLGISLGGMILQKYYFNSKSIIPTILISTMSEQNAKLKAVFNSWGLLANKSGLVAFKYALMPWIVNQDHLPIKMDVPDGGDEFSRIKEVISIKSVLSHDSTEGDTTLTRAAIIYGEKSPLINKSEVDSFGNHFKNITFYSVQNSGMRVLEENKSASIRFITEFLESSSGVVNEKN